MLRCGLADLPVCIDWPRWVIERGNEEIGADTYPDPEQLVGSVAYGC